MSIKVTIGKKFDWSWIILALTCFLGYSNSLQNQFMLDDYLILFGEKGVVNKSFFGIFLEAQGSFYRPVGHIFMWACSQLFGPQVFFYHVANLLLFIIICWLFYYIINFLSGNKNLALLSSLIYAVHPLNAAFVNYLTTSHISIFVITMQLSLISFLKYFDSGQRKLFFVSLVFFILSLLSHELAIVAPAYIFCFIYFLRRDRLIKSWPLVVAYVLVAAAFLIFRTLFFSLSDTGTVLKSVISLGNIYLSSVMGLIYWYVGKLVFPTDILFLWTGDMAQNYCSFEILRVAALLALLSYLLFVRWKKGLSAFALSVFIIGLIPTFAASYVHFPFVEPFIEPHWFYFSSIGYFILLAQGLLWIGKKIQPKVAYICFGVIIASMLFLLHENNKKWKDQEAYCQYWLSIDGRNISPYYGLGQVFLSRGQAKQAVDYLEKTLELSHYHSAFITADLGYAYLLGGDGQRAKPLFISALETDPNYSVTYYYVALVKMKESDKEGAEKFLIKAQSLYPKSNLYGQELHRLRSGLPLEGPYPLLKL